MNKDLDYIEELIEAYGETIPVPVELLVNPKYTTRENKVGKRLRHSRAILYGVLTTLDKDEDENGREYVTITGKEICDIAGVTNGSGSTNIIKDLEAFKLIERKPIKPGEPYQLYINKPTR